MTPSPVARLDVRVLDGVRAVPRAVWDATVGGDPTHPPGPFEDHRFLAALEESGSVGAPVGWTPFALAAESGGATVGLAAAYLTASARHPAFAPVGDRPPRPRLLLAPPFTPVVGRRLWTAATATDPAEVRRALLDAAVDLARARGACGVHLLDCDPADLDAADACGFVHRLDRHYAWHAEGDADFEAWLARMNARRRANIRRERRRVRDAGFALEVFRGDAIDDAHLTVAHALHRATAARFVGGRAHVTPAFFTALGASLRDQLVVTLALHGGRPIAASVDFEKANRRYGRYWGSAIEPDALYFEVCAHAPIADCIARGVSSFHAGPGGRAHKLPRGLLPTPASSAHLLFAPAEHDAVRQEAARRNPLVVADVEQSRVRVFSR